jgi:hypothetical protein
MLYRQCFSTSLQNTSLKEGLRKSEGLELNGQLKLLVSVDRINLLGKNTINKNTEAVLEANWEVGLEVPIQRKLSRLHVYVSSPECM